VNVFVVKRVLRAIRRRAYPGLLAAVVALAAPAAAQAHPTGPAIALDYRSTVEARPAAGVRASVLDGDRKLELSVDRRTTVTVLGYLDEPMLRIGPGGVLVNARSPTAWAERLAVSPPGKVTLAKPAWRRIADGPAFAWHDHRVAPRLAPGVRHARWSIGIVADGRRLALNGEFERVGRPALWPWLVLGLGLLGLGTGVTLARRLELSAAGSLAAAAVGGAAGLVSLAAFSFSGVSSGVGAWLELAAAAGLAIAAAAGLVLARGSRLVIAGGIGALAAIEGLGRLGVFKHGVVVSALPATGVRAADAVAIGAGLAALLIVLTYPSRRYAPVGPKRR